MGTRRNIATDQAARDAYVQGVLALKAESSVTTDQIPSASALHALYGSAVFRDFLCAALCEAELHEYADALSSVNLHYANKGQELGWHYDNSSFAITLMIQRSR